MKNQLSCKVVLLLFMISAMVSCESIDSMELDAKSAIYQEYQVTYNKTRNTTKVDATFRERTSKGTRITLSGDSKVQFNDENEDSFSTISHYFYHWKRDKIMDVTVVFNKNPKTTFVNKFSQKNSADINFVDDFTTFNGRQKNVIHWKGAAPKENEQVIVNIYQDKTFSMYATTEKGADKIEVEGLFSSGFKAGKVKVELIKKHSYSAINQSDKDAGGKVSYLTLVEKEVMIK
ncbi:hypothetical protein K5X82_08765 [Halosquirtibacter xylanolyticus]|uniref:hypothetical protein n=1 Tax=Halosquirtibacter xylanolyticus TaxID=3374599 RepID=UPI0037489B4B|nr:hypothetical protein K5X82_08765 [Prolixibacteraceae bacterium]